MLHRLIIGLGVHTAQVWDRTTGALVADLAGGHTGRIFCIGFDCTKVRHVAFTSCNLPWLMSPRGRHDVVRLLLRDAV